MDREVVSEIKRLEREIGFLKEADRRLRERISVASGDSSDTFYIQSSLNGLLSAGDGIDGGGSFPGTVSVGLDLVSAWSGLEISSAKLRINQAAAFDWTAAHSHTKDTTFDDGTTHSPKVKFIGGTNNDEANIFLVNSATPGDSNLGITLCDDAGSSELALRNLSGTSVVRLTSAGNVILNVDDTWVGRGAGSARLEFDNTGELITSRAADVVLERRCFGFLKAQNSSGRVGNGPIEYKEVVAVGGTMEIAPSAALNAAVTIN